MGFNTFDSTGKQQLVNSIANMPFGSIISWGADATPAGYLKCDGSAVSRTTYQDLFLAIGTNYGIGDGSTTFNLPDITGSIIYASSVAKAGSNLLPAVSDGSVTAAKLADSAVTTAKLTDANVTAAKLAQGAKGLVYIASASPSAASTVSFDNVFTSAYKNYRVIVSVTPATGTPQMRVRLRVSSSDNSNASYAFAQLYNDSHTANAIGYVRGSGDSSWYWGDTQNADNICVVDIANPQQTKYTSFVSNAVGINQSGQGQAFNGGGTFRATTSFDGFTLYPASSTFTGFVAVYAYTE